MVDEGQDGSRIGGTADVGRATVLTDVPGRPWTVEVVVPDADGLGLRRLVSVIAGIAVLVFASAVVALVLQMRHATRAAAELEDANRRFRDVAAADELTGLGNQARLVDDVTGLLSRGTRYGNGFALLAFDVDGADADEASVRGVAVVVQTQARGADRCYRVGARIVTLLPEQGLGGASIAAERVRAAVEASGIGTVSVGVATVPLSCARRTNAPRRTWPANFPGWFATYGWIDAPPREWPITNRGAPLPRPAA